jgi:hypothetical protein
MIARFNLSDLEWDYQAFVSQLSHFKFIMSFTENEDCIHNVVFPSFRMSVTTRSFFCLVLHSIV